MKLAVGTILAVVGAAVAWGTGYTLGEQDKTLPIKAADRAAVAASVAENGGTVNLKAGGRFSVTVDGNASTGYAWQIVEQPPFCRQAGAGPDGANDDGGAENRAGSPRRLTFSFQCDHAGTGFLVMEYRRPWEKEGKAEKVFRASIQVT